MNKKEFTVHCSHNVNEPILSSPNHIKQTKWFICVWLYAYAYAICIVVLTTNQTQYLIIPHTKRFTVHCSPKCMQNGPKWWLNRESSHTANTLHTDHDFRILIISYFFFFISKSVIPATGLVLSRRLMVNGRRPIAYVY